MKMNIRNSEVEILIAEDSLTQAEQLRYLLEVHGYTVMSAVNGKEALALARQHKPTLIISDILMPELNGYELCKAIKSDEILKDIPVILVTTLTESQDIMLGLECGADNFIRKPYDERYLLSRIEYLLMNFELRKNQRMQAGVEITLGQQKYFITSERQQMLDLLISTYEQAIVINEELKARESELKHSNEVLNGLYRITSGINRVASKQQVAEIALQRAMELPGVQAGWIWLREGDSGLRLVATQNLPPALDCPGALEGDCACRKRLFTGKLDSVSNIFECERLGKAKGDARGLRYHASVPLWCGDRTIGLMNLVGPQEGMFDEDALKVLYGVGNQVAVALERAHLRKNLEQLVVTKTAALRQSESWFRAVFNSQQDAVFVTTPEGMIINANAAVEEIFGYSVEELKGQSMALLQVDEQHYMEVVNHVQQSLADDSVIHFEHQLKRKNGEVFPTEHTFSPMESETGTSECIVRVVRDITHRKQAEKQLKLFRTLLDNSSDAIEVLDPVTFHFVDMNETECRVLGYSREELLTMSVFDIDPNVSADSLKMIDVQLRQSGRVRFETVHRRKDGSTFPVEISSSLIKLDKPYLLSIARDITERKQAEAVILQLNESLEQKVTERTVDLEHARHDAEAANQSKSAFLANMSHEIRTPMNGVIGMVDVLQQSSLNSQQMEMVDLIRESASSLLTIIDDILDFSKIEANRLMIEHAPMPLADTVEMICSMLDRLASRKNVELTMFTDPAIPEDVLGDVVRLRQILVNLISNAIKFSSGQDRPGRVSVRAALTERRPEQMTVEFQITDNGIGMDKKTLAGLFTPFTQADISTTRRFGGTGLGLSISYHLVELMDGEIAVQSEPGKGTTFTVRLPFALLPEKAAPDEPPSKVAGLSCLVVGGTDSLAGDLAAYLTLGGAPVERVAHLAAARERASVLPPGLGVWIIATGEEPPSPDNLRAAARTRPEQDIRFVVIGRGQRRKPRIAAADLVMLDGNALKRRTFLKAVAIAAGRAHEEVEMPFPGKGETAMMPPPSREEARRQGRLVLVAEDNEINQKVILHQLALIGFTADVTDNGRLALERWRSGDYALLLTDLHMPEMDGYELTAAIRAAEQGSRRIPVIALTANALRGEAEHCRKSGIDDYLSKPARLADLQAILEKWLPVATESAPVETNQDQLGRSQIVGASPDGTTDETTSHPTKQPEDGCQVVGYSQSTKPASGQVAGYAREEKNNRTQGVLLQQPAPPVDVNVLKALVGNDEAIIREFLHDFRLSAAKIAAELKAACNGLQAAHAGALAHKLKSSAHSMGALALGDLCAEMEQAGKSGQVEALTALLPRFVAEMAAVDEYLDLLLI